jgi:hypothetical protein
MLGDKDRLGELLGVKGIVKTKKRKEHHKPENTKQKMDALVDGLNKLLKTPPNKASPLQQQMGIDTPKDNFNLLPPEVDINLHPAFQLKAMIINWKYSQANSEAKLCYAARFNVIPMIDNILRAEPDLILGSEALATACLGGNIEAAIKLVDDYGADVNEIFKNFCSDYPICYAVSSGKIALVKFLIDRGAKLNIQKGSYSEQTPLQVCLSSMKNLATGKLEAQYIPIFRLLLQHGADPTVNMPLWNISLEEHLQKIQGDPELLRQAQEILSQANPSMEELTGLMQKHGLEQSEFDLLLCSIGSLSLEEEKSLTPKVK